MLGFFKLLFFCSLYALSFTLSHFNSARYRCQARRSSGGGLMYPFEGEEEEAKSAFLLFFFFNSCAATQTDHLVQKPAEPKTRVRDARHAHLPKALKQESTASMAEVPNGNGACTYLHFMIHAEIRHQIWYSPHAPSTGGGNAGLEASKGSTPCY